MPKDKGTAEGLKELAIDPSEPDQAVEKLRLLRSSEGADDSKIAAAAGQIASPGAAQLLAEMETGASGALRREIRRALFKLRQHGIEPILAPAPQPDIAVAAGEPLVSALISPVDGEGARLIWLSKARAQGG